MDLDLSPLFLEQTSIARWHQEWCNTDPLSHHDLGPNRGSQRFLELAGSPRGALWREQTSSKTAVTWRISVDVPLQRCQFCVLTDGRPGCRGPERHLPPAGGYP